MWSGGVKKGPPPWMCTYPWKRPHLPTEAWGRLGPVALLASSPEWGVLVVTGAPLGQVGLAKG